MRKFALSGLFALALTACGSDAAPGPTEQIIVREPGAPAPKVVAEEAGEVSQAGGTALIAEGKAVFAMCSACHVVDAGAASTSGPNLNGVVGQQAGAAADFDYSEALKSSGISWSEAELEAYLINPAAKIPGTTMVAGAVEDAAQRKAVIAYLKDTSSN